MKTTQERLDRAWDTSDMSTSKAAARLWARAVQLDESQTVAAGAVEPPPMLVGAHRRLVRSSRLQTETDYWVKENVRLRIPYAQWWREWERRYQAYMAPYRDWRIAVRIQAKKLGVPIPAWVF